ncbi:integrator complex subunit 9 [Bicyclus anynana]|uniref:Integrator complex subunit 9 n=1 Tax=Bicyclus anynana TaxID=110368 RepID=A0ABM3LEE2_BICAN|nr:integrator complex subunit 9 [Bicyclus anynana]
MKLYCLSGDAAKPCFVLSFKELLIMLDCGLSAHSLLSFLPLPPVPSTRLAALPAYSPPHVSDPLLDGELKECCGRVFVDSVPEFCPPLDKVVDFSQLDVILISNYTCMLALPFVTEDTGFKGRVYATEPTLQIGRFYLQELAEWLAPGAGGARAARRWKELLHVLPPPLAHARPRAWRRLFSRAALERSLARVRVVGYDERVDVFGALHATPVSSGYCLGSANWVLRSAHEKVAYVSGSSTLTTHPRPINQAALRGADLLLLCALTQTPAHNPDHMLGDLCVHAGVTLRAGGAVLCPVYPSGVLYDLLECLSAHLEGAGLAHVPLYVLSPAADASLAYSNILAEWVSAGKQARVYLPEEPFPHAALARGGRLRHARALADDALADFRQPCVVFAGHPSLRCGAAVHLLELWGASAAHAVIFTEPDFPHQEALAPFQPLAIKAFHCPIDTSLNFAQAGKLVRELRPRELALPEQYAGARPALAADVPTLLLRRGAARAPAVRRRAARAELCGELAARAAPRELRAGLRAAPLSAALRVRDARLTLEPAAGAGAALHWSALDVPALVAALAREGVGEARVEAGADGCIVHLPRHDTLVHVERHATHVFCEGRADVRQALRRALAACLPHI